MTGRAETNLYFGPPVSSEEKDECDRPSRIVVGTLGQWQSSIKCLADNQSQRPEVIMDCSPRVARPVVRMRVNI